MDEKERREALKASTGFETFNDMIAYSGWMVIRGVTKGQSLDSIMHSVFHLHANWIRNSKDIDK